MGNFDVLLKKFDTQLDHADSIMVSNELGVKGAEDMPERDETEMASLWSRMSLFATLSFTYSIFIQALSVGNTYM